MKIKLTQPLLDTEGKEITPKGQDKPQTLGEVLKQVALNPDQNEDQKAKQHGFEIFMKLLKSEKEADLSSEEISTLKKKAGKMLNILFYGQVAEMLEGNPNPIADVAHQD